MPTKMKTKDSLRRKRGRRKEKDRRRRKGEVDNGHRVVKDWASALPT